MCIPEINLGEGKTKKTLLVFQWIYIEFSTIFLSVSFPWLQKCCYPSQVTRGKKYTLKSQLCCKGLIFHIMGHWGMQIWYNSISRLEMVDQGRKRVQEETCTMSSNVYPEMKCISSVKVSLDFKREDSIIQLCSIRKKMRTIW